MSGVRALRVRRGAGRLGCGAVALLGPVLVFAGCTLGPDYRRPDVTTPAAWREEAAAAPTPASLADLPWWDLFQDEALRELIAAALEENNDLRIAVARVEQARAQLAIARAGQFPQLGASASATTNRASDTVTPRGFGGEFDLFATAVDLTFELDIWGRLRRATEAARAELLAGEETRRAVVMTLVSDVATAYLELRQLDQELETTRRNLASREASLALARDRYDAGLASGLDVHQAEAELASTAALIPDLERQVAQTEHRISTLLGRPPQAVRRGLALTATITPPAVPAGLPSALLERRPDIRQAEAALIAANARIGVARAAFFPQISLTGFFGVESVALSDLFTGPSRVWQFGPALTVPIFTAGRLRGNLAFVEAQQREALARYEQVIAQAFREVEDALVAHRRAREALARQTEAVRASRAALDIAEQRYTSGLTSYLDVLDAQRTLLTAEVAESRTLLAQLVAVARLYRALGGGWDSTSR
jgi:multidrug efflux system outer membrane protein